MKKEVVSNSAVDIIAVEGGWIVGWNSCEGNHERTVFTQFAVMVAWLKRVYRAEEVE